MKKKLTIRILKELSRWYNDKNFNVLCFLIDLETNEKNLNVKAAIKISISSILSRISDQDRGWGCIADNVLPKSYQVRHVDILNVFFRSIKNLLQDLSLISKSSKFEQIYRKISRFSSIYHANICKFNKLDNGSIDFVITSPPYPNMVDYISSHEVIVLLLRLRY